MYNQTGQRITIVYFQNQRKLFRTVYTHAGLDADMQTFLLSVFTDLFKALIQHLKVCQHSCTFFLSKDCP